MNTAVTQCPRCTGQAGAHFAFCFVAQAWERFMGPGYPWAPPVDDRSASVLWQDGYEQGRADASEPPAEEPEHEWNWAADHIPGPWDDDPPAYAEVAEDTAVAMGAPSDADWLPDGMWMPSIESAVTELPDDYYDQFVINDVSPPTWTRNTDGLRKAREEALRGQEDAAVQFVYDCCDFTPGGRLPLSDLYSLYNEWHAANDKPSMSKDRLRDLLVELGLTVEGGRLPGMRKAGRAPLLVHGLTVKAQPVVEEVQPKLPKVTVLADERKKHPLIGAKPGGELPKQVRELIEPLITEQRWEYQPHGGTGKGRPRVKSPDGKVCTLPSTPHLQGHTLENTRSFLKQNGAVL